MAAVFLADAVSKSCIEPSGWTCTICVYRFNIGATILHIPNLSIRIHGGRQTISQVPALSGLAIGVKIAMEVDELVTGNDHSIIGLTAFAVLLFQPIGGWLAHKLWVKTKRKSAVHISHRWIGRFFTVLGKRPIPARTNSQILD